MQTPYIDRWERTKRYLLRNFLVNPGFRLSPIPEEERSSPDSGSLPDLVLEAVPNRHDHPPDYYEGLERRMKRYYRKLFLGKGSDDDSSDFEVNRSMASTFMLNIDTRKDYDASMEADENFAGLYDDEKERQLTKSTNESQNQVKYNDKLIDTVRTYIDTSNVSADSKSSSVEDEDNSKLNEPINDNNMDDNLNVSIEAYDSKNYDDKDDQSCSTNGEKFEKSGEVLDKNVINLIEAKSDSEGSGPCHRMSTTVAEIHERRPERDTTQVFDNGSPVLIPRLLQFSRRVFGSSDVIRKSGQSFNVSKASDEFIRRLSSHKSDASNKHEDNTEEAEMQRLLTASDLTRVSLDSDKTHDNEKEIQHISTEDNQEDDNLIDDIEDRNDIEDRTDIEDEDQRSEIQSENEVIPNEEDETEITGIQNTSIDWNKDGIDDDEDCFDNAVRRGVFARKARKMVFISSSEESFDDLEPIAQSSAKSIDDEEVEVMREAGVACDNESWHGEAAPDSPVLAFEAQTDAAKLDDDSSDSTEINASFEEMEEANKDPHNTNPHIAKIIDDFWSVSSIDVDIEEISNENLSRGSKRRTDSAEDTPKRKKRNIAIQTSSEEHIGTWEDIRREFFVGSPVIFRLCGCEDHVCT